MDKMFLKSLSYRLCMLLSLLLLSQMVKAYDVEVDGIYYNLNIETKTAEVTWKRLGGDYSGNVIIPKTIKVDTDYSVTSIHKMAFYDCPQLTSITIPKTVSSIGDFAFQNCSRITSITIPLHVTYIGENILWGCNSLKEVHSDIENPFSISGEVFKGIPSETVLYVPQGTKSKYQAYSGWTANFNDIVEDDNRMGSESNPYNVSQAHALIQSLGADVESEEICVKGFISQIDNISPYPETAYGNATYWISDVKGSTAGQLEVWRGYSIGGEKFSSKDEIKEGDEVVIKGKVVNYRGNTPEFTSGSIIYSLNGQTAMEKPDSEYFGTLDEPITVSKAVELINALEDGGSTEKEAYVKGKITAIKTTDENIALYKNIDYIISDGTQELTVFRGKNLNNTDFTEAGQINVGDEVVVLGKLTKYVNNGNVIPEMAQGNYIVKFTYKSESSTCQLSISASGSGSVIFNGTTIRGKTTSFTLDVGKSATITFVPDNGYRISSVKVGNTEVTSSIRNNTYTISNITSNSTVSVVFGEREKNISLGDMNYTVTSYEIHTLSLARGTYGQVLTVPATVDYENETFTVTGMDADALKDASGLAAIIWNPRAAFTGQVSNPNFLLYVNDAEYAPSSVKNVVVNDKATSITLTDAANGNDFYCPREFTAEQISYTHRYEMTTGIEESRGWETIALPFDVDRVEHSTKGTVVPFASWNTSSVTKPFWLYQYGSGGFTEATVIRANTPYIISMPNNEQYLAAYRLNGTVTFSASNATVKATEEAITANNGDMTFVPCFSVRQAQTNDYALNVNNELASNSSTAVEGSRFIRNSRVVHPFEAYFTTSAQNARPFIPVFEEQPTGIKEVEILYDRVHGNEWFTIDGQKLSGIPTKKGVYIHNRKAVVR